VIRDQQGEVISSVNAVATGDYLKGQLADGELLLEVSDKNNKTLG
jgi:exonuclease VII large subunit